MIHLRGVRIRAVPPGRAGAFPFSVPVIANLATLPGGLPLRSGVTFLVGENGSGKSTLLEGIAAAARSIVVGAESVEADPTLKAARLLGRALDLDWAHQTKRGFFLRAEDFFGYAKRMQAMRDELDAERQVIADDPTLSVQAKSFGQLPYATELAAIQRQHGDGLDARSHGEAFLTLFQSRFVLGGLYLLDEPEAPLSPTRQLALISMIKGMAEDQGGQFVIATHSPILMAYPGATIYGFDGGTVREVAYNDVEHVDVTRRFLTDPGLFLRHL